MLTKMIWGTVASSCVLQLAAEATWRYSPTVSGIMSGIGTISMIAATISIATSLCYTLGGD